MQANIKYLEVKDFLTQSKGLLILDVRAPKEYKKGHISEAVSFPLFDDAERAEVGTTYKQKSKEKAIELGLDIVGKKMGDFARTIKTLTQGKQVFIHCWRGGMRSGSLAWLINLLGYEVVVLEGGYKAYRNYVLKEMAKPYKLLSLSGKTGTGKTEILYALEKLGAQIVDLEKIAHHKGSAFGGLGQAAQPSPEQFENNLFEILFAIDKDRECWIEDESKSIGSCYLPEPFWAQMKLAPRYDIHVSDEKRLAHIMIQYSQFDREDLSKCIRAIEKRLGVETMNIALDALAENNLLQVAKMMLHYYDKAYAFGIPKKVNCSVKSLIFEEQTAQEIAQVLIDKSK